MTTDDYLKTSECLIRYVPPSDSDAEDEDEDESEEEGGGAPKPPKPSPRPWIVITSFLSHGSDPSVGG